MSLSNQFETDKQAEVDGVWVEYGANENGTIPGFKISRMSKANKKYTKALEKATRPHRRAIELETMNNDLAERLFMQVFVDTVLLEWRNVPLSDVTGNKDDEGFATFNSENAMMLFERLNELYDDLQEKAKKASLFREETLEGEAGN